MSLNLQINLKKLFPKRKQWGYFFSVLEKKEKVFFFFFAALFFGSLIYLGINYYLKNTIVSPALSGTLREGFIGQPQLINPVFSTSEIDQSLVELIFSSLMTYQDGKFSPDLIENYQFQNDGKTFEFSIKNNVKWHDGKPLTVDDIVFTLNLIQEPKSLSPKIANWQGIELEKKSDYEGVFTLKQPYSNFLENLAQLKILPKHIWENVAAENLSMFPELNVLSPIGSGPYQVLKVKQKKDKSVEYIELKANQNYYRKLPYIQTIKFIFFNSDDDLINALNAKKIDAAWLKNKEESELIKEDSLKIYQYLLPDYFSVFFNLNNKVFEDKDVRMALTLAQDKDEIIQNVFNDSAEIVNSPILPEFYGYKEPQAVEPDKNLAKSILEKKGFEEVDGKMTKIIEKLPEFQIKSDLKVGSEGAEVEKLQECLAKDPDIYPGGEITGYFGQNTKSAVIAFQEKYKDEILTPAGLSQGTGEVKASTRKKLNELCWPTPTETIPLSFSLYVPNQENLIKVAQKLINNWQEIGADVKLEVKETQELQKIIKERSFDALLFGISMNAICDPLPFWHSSQIVDPGRNICSYKNENADKLLEEARKFYDPNDSAREEKLESFQEIVIQDYPAIFLYSPKYFYVVSNKIKGISSQKLSNSANRFSQIENWYIKTTRIWQ